MPIANDITTKKRIMVVEDDEDSRRALCVMLEGLGFEAISYRTAMEALSDIPNQKIDLALLDIMMPQMNGYELLHKIKEMPQYKDLPVIMVTAKDEDSEVLEGYQFGADYYITKPYTSKQVEYGIKIFLT